jgi:hypothetical protein
MYQPYEMISETVASSQLLARFLNKMNYDREDIVTKNRICVLIILSENPNQML